MEKELFEKDEKIIDGEYEDIEILSEEEVQEELRKNMGKAQEMLKDKDKLGKFLKRLEKKIKFIPKIGYKLSGVIVMASLLRDYSTRKYLDMPIGTMTAVISALVYFVSPIDIIPDTIPFFGLLDDAAVVAACLKMVESDIEEYKRWRENNE